MRLVLTTLCSSLLLTLASACSKTDKPDLAPATSALSSAAPVTASAKTYALDTKRSSVEFTMDAELEQISGRAPAAAEGKLFIDPTNLSKTSGLIKVDLDKLSIYKRNRDEASAEFGAEEKNDKQNRDMRNWFQIGEDAPPDDREKFRWAEFKIVSVKASQNDVTALSGATRKLEALVTGDFRLHGRTTKKSLQTELTFSFKAGEVEQVSVETEKPFDIGLEEHDIKPRKSFAQLADATLDALGKKVSKVAQVSLQASLTPTEQ